MAKATNEPGDSQADNEETPVGNQPGADNRNSDEGDDPEFVMVEVDPHGNRVNDNSQQGNQQQDNQQAGPEDEEEDGDADPEDEEEDDTVGHNAAHEQESDEERRARRRGERQAKRITQRRLSVAKDRKIDGLTRAVHGLMEQMAGLQGRTIKYDNDLLRRQVDEIDGHLAQAKTAMAACVKAADGDGVAEVTEIQFQLRDRKRNLEMMLARANSSSQQQQQRSQQQQVPRNAQQSELPADVIAGAARWAGQNSWYSPEGTDNDSETVRAIDDEMAKEGFDPATPQYWTELTTRVRAELPHRFNRQQSSNGGRPNGQSNRMASNNGNGRNNDGAGNGRQKQQQQRPSGPRMAATQNRRLGKNEVYITPERKAAMIAAGYWEDPKKRNNMLKRYAEHDASEANNA